MGAGRKLTFRNFHFSVQNVQNVLSVVQCTSVCSWGQNWAAPCRSLVHGPDLIHRIITNNVHLAVPAAAWLGTQPVIVSDWCYFKVGTWWHWTVDAAHVRDAFWQHSVPKFSDWWYCAILEKSGLWYAAVTIHGFHAGQALRITFNTSL